MRKLIILTLALAMLLTLAACGGKTADSELDSAKAAFTAEADRITEEMGMLQDLIDTAENALQSGREPMDAGTRTALEAVLQEAKDSIRDVPEMPETAEEIRSETEKLKAVSYTDLSHRLTAELEAFTKSQDELENAEPDAGDSVSEASVSDGCYITALLGSYHGDTVDGSANSYEIRWEDPYVVVYGSMNYNQDPDLTYYTDSTDLMISAPNRFQVTDGTEYRINLGSEEEELSREEFIATAQDYMDRDNGPALMVSVKNGKVTRMLISS